jgi:hypothetical protein
MLGTVARYAVRRELSWKFEALQGCAPRLTTSSRDLGLVLTNVVLYVETSLL